MKINILAMLLLIVTILSCGQDKLNKVNSTSTGSGSGTSQIGYFPGSPNYAPVILSLYYYDNGTSVEWEYPLHQVANYRVEFCSNASFTNCSKVIQVSCDGPNNCIKTAGATGIIAVGDGRMPGRGAILYSYQPTGQTYAIRVRAESNEGISEWMVASQCAFSLPAQCSAP